MAVDSAALLLASLAVSVPTFAWVGAGLVGRRLGWLTPVRNDTLARFSFKFAMPVVLFFGAAGVDYSDLGRASHLWSGVLATLTVVLLALVWGGWRKLSAGELGVFVQCAFRSNLALIGIALAIAAYGQRGLVLAALPVAVMTVMYNVIAVVLLNATLGGSRSPLAALRGVLGNPLIIGIAAGVAWSLLQLDIAPLQPLSDVASSVFVPMALVAVGGSMDLTALRGARAVTWEATLWRLCIAPAIGLLVALGMGVRGDELGVLFLLLASPVAAASYVMVVAARGDGTLAANLVVLTTLLSAATIPLGFFALQLWQARA